MRGTYSGADVLTIVLHTQGEMLEAPTDAIVGRRKWIACEWCGAVLAVPLNVVSTLCVPCEAARATGEHWQDHHCKGQGDLDESGGCNVCGVIVGDQCVQCGGERFHDPGCLSLPHERLHAWELMGPPNAMVPRYRCACGAESGYGGAQENGGCPGPRKGAAAAPEVAG